MTSILIIVQMMLKKQFQGILGLKPTLLLSAGRKTALPASGALQIIHARGNHWIVASTIGCTTKLLVFDSLYCDIDKPTRELLSQLIGANVEIKLQNAPKQRGIKECGVFAIVICTSLACGNFPSHITFNQSIMRDHLIQCYKNLCLTPFPPVYIARFNLFHHCNHLLLITEAQSLYSHTILTVWHACTSLFRVDQS